MEKLLYRFYQKTHNNPITVLVWLLNTFIEFFFFHCFLTILLLVDMPTLIIKSRSLFTAFAYISVFTFHPILLLIQSILSLNNIISLSTYFYIFWLLYQHFTRSSQRI